MTQLRNKNKNNENNNNKNKNKNKKIRTFKTKLQVIKIIIIKYYI